jgi:hypothetical protein
MINLKNGRESGHQIYIKELYQYFPGRIEENYENKIETVGIFKQEI